MAKCLWIMISVVVILTEITFATEVIESETNNTREGRFAKGEIPLLIIRPMEKKHSKSAIFSSRPSQSQGATTRVSSNEDMSILGSILPQLGLDPKLFSAFSTDESSDSKKMHVIPVPSDEDMKFLTQYNSEYHHQDHHHSQHHQNYPEQIVSITPHKNYIKSSINSKRNHNKKPLKQHSSTHRREHHNPSHKQQYSQPANLNYLYDADSFHPTFNSIRIDNHVNSVTPISESYNEILSPNYYEQNQNNPKLHNNQYQTPQKPHHYSHQTQIEHKTQSHQYLPQQQQQHQQHQNPIQFVENYFSPKPIDFNLIKVNEELLIGKPTSVQINTNYNALNTKPGGSGIVDNHFYVPQHENTASFEVKSKTENVQFITEQQKHSAQYKPLQSHLDYTQKIELPIFKQSPKIEYFIPKEQETVTVKVKTDPDEFYKTFETDEYFLPKKTPKYQNFGNQFYSNIPSQFVSTTTTSTTEYPIIQKNKPYSFVIDDDGFSNIHIQDHIYSKPEQLHLNNGGITNVEKTVDDNQFLPFYPINHREFDSKLSALDFVKSSIKENLDSIHEDNKKFLSSSYSNEESISPHLLYGSELYSTLAPPTVSQKPIPMSYNENSEPSYYNRNENEDRKELNSYYNNIVSTPTPAVSYSRPSFSVKQNDIRPIYEESENSEEITPASSDWHGDSSEYLPVNLYLNDRSNEPNESYIHYESNVSTESNQQNYEYEVESQPTTTEKIDPTTTPLKKYRTKSVTPKITTYKAKYLPTTTTTIAPDSVEEIEEIDTTTEQSSPKLLTGIACERQCIRNTVTQDYDPVCGSDGKVYSNKGKLRCIRNCGKSHLRVKHYGSCGHNN